MLDVLRPDIAPRANCTSFGMSMTTGPGRPVLRDVERLVQDARQIFDRADQIIVLGAMAGDADRVAFLKGVRCRSDASAPGR